MIPFAEKAGPALTGTDLRNSGLATYSENSLENIRAQYLAEIFALSAATSCTIAELAFGFGEGGR